MVYQAPSGYEVVMDVPLQKQDFVLGRLLNGKISGVTSELVEKIELLDPHDSQKTLELILLVCNDGQSIIKLFAQRRDYNKARESLAERLLSN